jgi:UDP-2-acetamido-3-amino-2,3-dideoxy-glucuronate N-acetyltransferase
MLGHGPEPSGLEDYRGENCDIHEWALVDPPCHIGALTRVHPFSHIMGNTIVGDACHIGHHVTVGSGVILGNRVRVLHYSQLHSGVILEDDVQFGPGAAIVSPKRFRPKTGNISQISPTLVRRGASVGPNVLLATGLTVGCYAFVQPGAVVERNIPDYAVATGDPVRIEGWRCSCGELLTFPDDAPGTLTMCTYCRRTYEKKAAKRIAPVTLCTEASVPGQAL